MIRRLRLAQPVEVLEEEAWEVPDSLTDDEGRAEFGLEGRGASAWNQEEDDR